MSLTSPDVILFDGVCNLCNGFVQFLIHHDQASRFRFAALQSDAAQALLVAHGLAPIAPGNLQIHWPEGNIIIRIGITDPAGGVPDYNTRVRVEN